jgi:hypothetical protein
MGVCTRLMKILLTNSASRMGTYQSPVLTVSLAVGFLAYFNIIPVQMVNIRSTGATRVTVVQPTGGKNSRYGLSCDCMRVDNLFLGL